MHGDQANDSMTMPGQHNILTGLGPTDEIGQTRFGFCDCELHVVLLSQQYGPFDGPFQAVTCGVLLRIISDNQQYSTYDGTADEVNIIGRVRWYGREM